MGKVSSQAALCQSMNSFPRTKSSENQRKHADFALKKHANVIAPAASSLRRCIQ